MDRPADGLGDGIALTAFLRGEGFRLGVGDDLRLAELRQRLGEQGIALPDGRSAARWLGPVLCRNPDQSGRLPDLLDQWLERVRLERPGDVPASAGERFQVRAGPPAPVAPAPRAPGRRSRSWVALAVLLLIGGLVIGLTAVFQWGAVAPPAPVAVPLPNAAPQPVPDGTSLWSGLTDDLEWTLSRGLAALVPIAAAGAYLWSRRRRRLAVLRGLAPRDAPRAALALRVRDLPLFRPGVVRTALRDLRRHRLVPSDAVDGRASLAATVAGAGFVRLVHARRPVTPDYLLLVDRVRQDDHLALLAELLVDRLSAEQVHVTRYDYRGDPRILQRVERDGRPGPMTDLETLRESGRDHRLLLLTDGANFTDPASGADRGWVELLRRWEVSAVVTPAPQATWGPRERGLMRRGFLVVEASPRGLRDLAGQVRSDLPVDRASPAGPEPLALDRRLARAPFDWTGDRAPADAQVVGLIGDLRAALGADGLHYLAALAVFPAVHPKLTLLVGNALADRDGRPLLTEDRLASLCRLPWLRRGRIPDWLRLALVRELQTEPDRAAAVRHAWTALLEPVPEGERETLRFPIVPRTDADARSIINDLVRRGQAPDLEEAILLRFLNDLPVGHLGFDVPERVGHELRPWMTSSERLGLVAMTLVAIALAWQPNLLIGPLFALAGTLPEWVTTIGVVVLIIVTMLTSAWRGAVTAVPRGVVWVQWFSLIASIALSGIGLFSVKEGGKAASVVFTAAIFSWIYVNISRMKDFSWIFEFLSDFFGEKSSVFRNLFGISCLSSIAIYSSIKMELDKTNEMYEFFVLLGVLLVPIYYVFCFIFTRNSGAFVKKMVKTGCYFYALICYSVIIWAFFIVIGRIVDPTFVSITSSYTVARNVFAAEFTAIFTNIFLVTLSMRRALLSLSEKYKGNIIAFGVYISFSTAFIVFYMWNVSFFNSAAMNLAFGCVLTTVYIVIFEMISSKSIAISVLRSIIGGIFYFILIDASFEVLLSIFTMQWTPIGRLGLFSGDALWRVGWETPYSLTEAFVVFLCLPLKYFVFPIVAAETARRWSPFDAETRRRLLADSVADVKALIPFLAATAFAVIMTPNTADIRDLGVIFEPGAEVTIDFVLLNGGLAVWLARRHPWPLAARPFLFAAPLFIVGLHTDAIATVFEPGLLVAVLVLVRLVADADFRQACRTANGLSWRAWAVLLLPMGLGVTATPSSWLSLGWSPGPLAVMLFGLVGFSAMPLAVPLRVVGGVAALSVLASVTPVGSAVALPWWEASMVWLPLTPAWGVSMAAALLCGRAIRDALDAGPAHVHATWGFPTVMVALFLLPHLVVPSGGTGEAVSNATLTMLHMPALGVAGLAGLRYGMAGVRSVTTAALAVAGLLMVQRLAGGGAGLTPSALVFGGEPFAALSLSGSFGIGLSNPGLIELAVTAGAAVSLAFLSARWRTVPEPAAMVATEGNAESPAVGEAPDDQLGTAMSYEQLGRQAEGRRAFDKAWDWYIRPLAIRETLGDRFGMASSCHQLGMVAQARGDLDLAEEFHRRSLAIRQDLDDRLGIAASYHQLGMVAQARGDRDGAEEFHRKALAIQQSFGNQPDTRDGA